MSKKEDKIKGGYADGKTAGDIAKKHGVSLKDIEAQLKMGKKVEMEHVDDSDLAEEIALDHLYEIPDYYDRLEDMEKEAKKEMKEKSMKTEGKENISEYARRMRELAGLSEGNQKKSLKTIQEGESSFENGATFMASDLMGESKEELENPEKADLDDNGELSKYEKKRGKAVEKAMKKKSINENYMSDELYEKMRAEAINYLVKESGWVTVVYDPNNSDLMIYKGAVGLDPERDEVEPEDMENYMEISADEALELVKSGKVTPYLMDEIPSLETMNESADKEEFETHKFEQKTIEEGENDAELYSLNENTIIVLDFLNEGFYEDDDEFAERDALMAELEEMYPDAWFKESERFQGHGGGIWTGEGSYDKEGREIFSYWSNSPDYEIGVLKSFNDFIESKGFWAEWQDAGTIMIWPK